MRKVTAGLLVSPSGVTESPGNWQLPYFNDEMGEAVGVAMAATNAMLLARVSHRELASYWPGMSSEAQLFAYHMNSTPEHIVSRTLEEPLERNNSTFIKGDIAEEISRLKQQPGKNIGITGSVTPVQSLLDDLGLMIHPVVVGAGRRLFDERGDPKGLKLVDSKTFGSGVVSLTYQPDGEEAEG